MRDIEPSARISSALSHVLTEISTLSNARVGAICDIAPSGLLRLLAVRSNPQSESDQHSIVTVYAPAVVLNSVVAERVQVALRSTRPHVITLPRSDIAELVAILGAPNGSAHDNSILVIPSRSGTLGILLIGPKPWNTPPLAYLRTKFDEATDEFDFLSGARTTDQITHLLVELSSAVSESLNSTQGAAKICKIIGTFFGYRSASSFSFEDGRLLPISISKRAATEKRNEPIHPSHFNGLYKVAKKAFESRTIVKFTIDDLNDFPVEILNHLDLKGESLLLPLLRGDNYIGAIVLSKPIAATVDSLFENASATVLMRHLSLLFAQLVEDYEKDVRLRASSSVTPLLDATTQIVSMQEMGDLLAQSIAMSLASPRAFFFLLDDQKYISKICMAGSETDDNFELSATWNGKFASRFSFFSQLTISHDPIFFEPSTPGAYPSEIRELVGMLPYVTVPISTSDGLIGFALAAQPRQRPYWSSFDKTTTTEWSVSATLVADNVGLRLAERSHLENYREKAFKDSLTGLPNRELLMDRIAVATAKAQRTKQRTAVIFIDIDYFKQVNDTFGHSTGDELLVQFAKRLTTSFRDTDTVARLSGDEFVVLLENSPPELELLDLARRAFHHINDTYRIFSDQIAVSTSMGIAIGEPGITGAELLERADEYMYRSKESGRGRLSVYSQSTISQSAGIDLRQVSMAPENKNLSATQKSNEFLDTFKVLDRYFKFSADYVEIARLRAALAGIMQDRYPHVEAGTTTQIPSGQSHLLSDVSDLQTEFTMLGKLQTQTPDPSAIELLESIIEVPVFQRDLAIANMGKKTLLELTDITRSNVTTLADLVAGFSNHYRKSTQLILSLTSTQLHDDPWLLEAISTISLRFRSEIMITQANHRSLRFHDIMMPMVNYLALPAQIAEQDASAVPPNTLSALFAIARDRGIRLVAQGVKNPAALDQLLLAGVTVISGPAISENRALQQTYRQKFMSNKS